MQKSVRHVIDRSTAIKKQQHTLSPSHMESMSKHISSKREEQQEKKPTRHTAIVKYVSTCNNQGQYCVTVWCHRRKYRCNAYQKWMLLLWWVAHGSRDIKRNEWREKSTGIELNVNTGQHKKNPKYNLITTEYLSYSLLSCSCPSSSSSWFARCSLFFSLYFMLQTHIQWPRCLSR